MTQANPFAATAPAAANPFANPAAAQALVPPALPAAAPPTPPVVAAAAPSATTPDPFGTSGPDQFSDARSGFLTAKDFDGRLLLIDVTGPKGQRISKSTGQPYDYIQCDVTVLDGGPSDKVPNPGETTDVQLTGAALLPALMGKIGKGYPAQRVLGRMTSGPSRVNQAVMAYWLSEPTDPDRQLARQYLAAQRAKAQTADPFGVPA